MNKVQAAFSGIALAGVVGFASVTPAAADPVDVKTKTGPSVSQAGEVAPMVGHQVRLNKLRALTGNDQASQNQWFDYLALNQEGSNYYRFDWSTDGCSKVSDSPLGFHFYSACHRHDFGYRNHKKLSVFSAANKLRIDQAFLSDMTKVCNGQWGPYTPAQRAACRNVAKKYYQAVRTFGELRP